MNFDLIIRPEAESDMAEAFDWYEARVPGLGSDFLLHVDAILQRIVRNPAQFPLVHRTVRRGTIRRFPYGVIFVAEKRRVTVLGVFHAKRDPKTWQERLTY